MKTFYDWMQQSHHNKIHVAFATDRPLDEEELSQIEGHAVAQVNEPVDGEGEDVDFVVSNVVSSHRSTRFPHPRQYNIEIKFNTNRELTTDEFYRIEGSVIAQIQEPSNDDGTDMDVRVMNVESFS